MDSPLIIIMLITGLLVVAGLILAAVVWKKRREINEERTDYRAFFIMGIVLLTLGIAGFIVAITTDIPFVVAVPILAIGLVYMTIGLANRAKWKH